MKSRGIESSFWDKASWFKASRDIESEYQANYVTVDDETKDTATVSSRVPQDSITGEADGGVEETADGAINGMPLKLYRSPQVPTWSMAWVSVWIEWKQTSKIIYTTGNR